MQVLEFNGGRHYVDEGGSTMNPQESVEVLLTRRVPLEAPKEKDGNTLNEWLEKGEPNNVGV